MPTSTIQGILWPYDGSFWHHLHGAAVVAYKVATYFKKNTQVTLTAVLWPAACSSSLLALHDAVTDIKAGRCDYAVVAGISAIMSPNVTMGFNKLMASPL